MYYDSQRHTYFESWLEIKKENEKIRTLLGKPEGSRNLGTCKKSEPYNSSAPQAEISKKKESP
jgi:hypothetical protein